MSAGVDAAVPGLQLVLLAAATFAKSAVLVAAAALVAVSQPAAAVATAVAVAAAACALAAATFAALAGAAIAAAVAEPSTLRGLECKKLLAWRMELLASGLEQLASAFLGVCLFHFWLHQLHGVQLSSEGEHR